jgi:hypothetical protein
MLIPVFCFIFITLNFFGISTDFYNDAEFQ